MPKPKTLDEVKEEIRHRISEHEIRARGEFGSYRTKQKYHVRSNELSQLLGWINQPKDV
jgi:hypothetical protein